MYIKKVKLATNGRIKIVFQESEVKTKLAGMSLKAKDGERYTIVTVDAGAMHSDEHPDVELAGQPIIPLAEQLANAKKEYPVGTDFTADLAFGEQAVYGDKAVNQDGASIAGQEIPNLFDYVVL